MLLVQVKGEGLPTPEIRPSISEGFLRCPKNPDPLLLETIETPDPHSDTYWVSKTGVFDTP